jgi:hypothetical protein
MTLTLKNQNSDLRSFIRTFIPEKKKNQETLKAFLKVSAAFYCSVFSSSVHRKRGLVD